MSCFPSVAFLTGSAGSGEWIVLFVVILIVVGPRRMPEVARKIGRMMEMFRRAADEFKDQLMTMDQEPLKPSAEVKRSTTDVDGVLSSDVNNTSSTAPYDAVCPNEADDPGNGKQVKNVPSNSLSAVAGADESPPLSEPEKSPEVHV
jgi:Sec-independent protein translocase protein TatA